MTPTPFARSLCLAAVAVLPLSCSDCGTASGKGSPADSSPAPPSPARSSLASAPPGPAAPGAVSPLEDVEALASRLQALRQGGGKDGPGVYRVPSAGEERLYRAWVRAAIAAAAAGAPAPHEAPEGFALEERKAGASTWWLLGERASQRRGAGALVLRVGAAVPVVVEAPHTFYDAGTLPLALEVFRHGGRALLVNTMHRYRARGQGPEGARGEADDAEEGTGAAAESDVAHAPRSFFLAAHEELIAAHPGDVAVQLHGFADRSVPGASVVLSAALGRADLGPVARGLREVLGGPAVKLYPSEVRALGATTNVEGRASARAGAPFVHVETSKGLRDRLAADRALRERFGSELFRSVSAARGGGP